ncbi:hypothetical protein KEM56_003764 [Ascosphaera pollenicola]|nr:hypothetical protein KEM56_003764 [Ascosphaera pollenicola]
MAAIAAISDPSASQLAQSLSPYVKSRQEAINVRRAITTFLSSQVVPSYRCGDAHLSLCAPHDVSEVKSVPALVEGQIYAEYLAALQANADAKREYHRSLESYKDELNGRSQSKDDDTAAKLQTYAALMRSRREEEKFDIYREYMSQLTQTNGSQYGYLSLSDEQAQVSQLSQNLASHIGRDGDASENMKEDVDCLIHRLERAVIQAKAEAQSEADKLAAVERRGHIFRMPTSSHHSHGSNVHALSRTRDELVQWVETALTMSTNDEEDTSADDLLKNNLDAAHSGEDGKAFIMEQYGAYLESRKLLLSTVTEFLRHLPNKQVLSRRRPPLQPKELDTPASFDIATTFSYVTQNVVPLSRARMVSETQSKQLSSNITRESKKALQMLNRLQEESHLLREYAPAEDHQPWQQQHRRALSAPVLSPSSAERDQTPAAEIAKRAAVWAAAASEARLATRVAVAGQIETGREHLENADEKLQEIYRGLNQDVGDPAVGGRSSTRAAGPWCLLKGDIALQ